MSDPDTTTVASVGAGAAVLLGFAYRFFRLVKGDNKADRVDAVSEALRTNMMAENAELKKRADVFAGERNAALITTATLEERNRALTAEVERLKKELAEYERH